VPDSTSSQEWTLCSPDLTLTDYLVWDVLQELVYEERCKLFANFKDLQNVIRDKWHDVDIRQWESEKPHSSEKASSSSSKGNLGPIQHIFWWPVDCWFDLLWHSGVAYVWAECKWWASCIICFMMQNTVLFLSCLMWKCFKRKFLDIFEDVCSLQTCFSADLFWLLRLWLLDWKRPFGRPRLTCLHTLGADLQPYKLGVNSAWKYVQDQEHWKRLMEIAMLQLGACAWWWWWLRCIMHAKVQDVFLGHPVFWCMSTFYSCSK